MHGPTVKEEWSSRWNWDYDESCIFRSEALGSEITVLSGALKTILLLFKPPYLSVYSLVDFGGLGESCNYCA